MRRQNQGEQMSSVRKKLVLPPKHEKIGDVKKLISRIIRLIAQGRVTPEQGKVMLLGASELAKTIKLEEEIKLLETGIKEEQNET